MKGSLPELIQASKARNAYKSVVLENKDVVEMVLFGYRTLEVEEEIGALVGWVAGTTDRVTSEQPSGLTPWNTK